jgi:hypothetical protein
MNAADIVASLGGKMRSRSSGTACCPAHKDRTPSLSVTDGRDGIVLVHCHAGCSQASVITQLRRLDAWPAGETQEPTVAEREARRLQERQREEERARRHAFVEHLWRETWDSSEPLAGSPISRIRSPTRSPVSESVLIDGQQLATKPLCGFRTMAIGMTP